MSVTRSVSLCTLACAGAASIVIAHHAAQHAPQGSHESRRIQRHIAAAEQLMQRRDLSALTPEQIGARERLVVTLAHYREDGRFPHNHDFPDQMVPYFVDEHGTLCAVGYLIASTGRWDLVQAVRQKMNNARVREIADDPSIGPALSDWLKANGITLAEAAAIQPAYQPPEPSARRTAVTDGYAAASVATYAGSAVGFVANTVALSQNQRTAWPLLNIISGVGGVALSIPELDERGSRRTFAYANLGVGVTSLIAGTVAWVMRSEATPVSAPIATLIETDLGGRSRVGVRVRF